MTTRPLPVIRESTTASAETIATHPTVENRYASTVEQSRNPSGNTVKACKILVSRIVATVELRNATPIIGTMPHSTAVAITTAAVLATLLFFMRMIPVKHSSPCRYRIFASGVSPENGKSSVKTSPIQQSHAGREQARPQNLVTEAGRIDPGSFKKVYVLADFLGKMASAVALFVYLAAFGIRTV